MSITKALSLNETQDLAKRAARGAGYSWGLCEEAAKAVRWLCVYDLDGVAQLASLLDKSLAKSPIDHRPGGNKLIWQGNTYLCPLATGAYLSDSAKSLPAGELKIRRLLFPTLLLPFVSNVALLNKQTISIQCENMVATTDGMGIDISKSFSDSASQVSIRTGGSMLNRRTKQDRAFTNSQCLQVLKRYADLTYAPATEESRLVGAGAGLSDND